MADAFEISSSEARRLLKQGGVKLDGEALDGERLDLDPIDLDGHVIQAGKRRFRRLRAGA
jgi:tyrosyl-tRNA synthetase